MLLFLAIPIKTADHYCYSLDNVNNSVVQVKVETCSDYQNNTFLLDQLLVMDTLNTGGFCCVLQNTENQQKNDYMLVNGKSRIKFVLFLLLFLFLTVHQQNYHLLMITWTQ